MRLPLALLLLAAGVRAQPATDLFPLHEGDTWTYRAWGYTATSLSDFEFSEFGHERWTASQVTADGDTTRAALTIERWNADGQGQEGATCRVSRVGAEGLVVHLEAVRGRCSVPGAAGADLRTGLGFYRHVEEVVAGQSVPLWVANGFPDFRRLQARARDTGAQVVSGGWVLASGMGLFLSDSTEARNGRTTSYQLSLVHARVGGREVGRPMDFDGAEGGEIAVVRIGPNPFGAAATLAFQTARPESVTVEVFDARGRLLRAVDLGDVPAGVHEHRLDGRDLAAGVYLVRVSTARGRSAVQRVVHVE